MAIKFTEIFRLSDGLQLAGSFEDAEEATVLKPFREQAKRIIRGPIHQHEQKSSVDSPPYVFHILKDSSAVYVALCEKNFSVGLAFDYLTEIQREFQTVHGQQISSVDRAYAFIRFDTFIEKTKRVFVEPRGAGRQLSSLNTRLHEVTQIVRRNVEDVLGRGEKLETVSNLSQRLATESKKYLRNAKELNQGLLLKKYGPFAIVAFIVLAVFYIWH